MKSAVPAERILSCNEAPIHTNGSFVLYWMTAFRRTRWNYSLQRAAEWAEQLEKPLVVFEPLRVDHRWANARSHRFVLDGMAVNAEHLADGAFYFPYVEQQPGGGRGLLEALSRDACIVVTDDYPAYFLHRMVDAVAPRLKVRLEKVDSNGLLPMRLTTKLFSTAHAFRRHLHKNLPDHLPNQPKREPLGAARFPELDKLPDRVTQHWTPTTFSELTSPEFLKGLPLDQSVAPPSLQGGQTAGQQRLESFLEERLPEYSERNHPDESASSGLSPYLHFGHISAHEIFAAITSAENWDVDAIAPGAQGRRSGWWGLSEPGEAFLDQLITWREVGFNMCSNRDDYDRYESLPDWALRTLGEHEDDEREHIYELEAFERADTHDEIWNAAQRQLITDGTIHNYLRMLWGKKILEWTATPRDALAIMIELNNKYALDGRDPNSYSGIFWCLGRYDRAWGPERPIFGKIRYMSSENTRRKLRLKDYLNKFAG